MPRIYELIILAVGAAWMVSLALYVVRLLARWRRAERTNGQPAKNVRLERYMAVLSAVFVLTRLFSPGEGGTLTLAVVFKNLLGVAAASVFTVLPVYLLYLRRKRFPPCAPPSEVYRLKLTDRLTLAVFWFFFAVFVIVLISVVVFYLDPALAERLAALAEK